MAKKSPKVQVPTDQTPQPQPAPAVDDTKDFPEPVAVIHIPDAIPVDVVKDVVLPEEPQQDAPMPETASEADSAREEFIRQLTEHRNRPVPVYVPPPMSERQLSKREAEMEAGRRRVEANKAAGKTVAVKPTPPLVDAQGRPIMPRRPMNPIKAGTNTPIIRPADYVHESRKSGARTTREG